MDQTKYEDDLKLLLVWPWIFAVVCLNLMCLIDCFKVNHFNLSWSKYPLYIDVMADNQHLHSCWNILFIFQYPFDNHCFFDSDKDPIILCCITITITWPNMINLLLQSELCKTAICELVCHVHIIAINKEIMIKTTTLRKAIISKLTPSKHHCFVQMKPNFGYFLFVLEKAPRLTATNTPHWNE